MKGSVTSEISYSNSKSLGPTTTMQPWTAPLLQVVTQRSLLDVALCFCEPLCLLHHCFGATEEPCNDAPCDFTLRRVADAGIVEGGWGCKSSRSKKSFQGGPETIVFNGVKWGPYEVNGTSCPNYKN